MTKELPITEQQAQRLTERLQAQAQAQQAAGHYLSALVDGHGIDQATFLELRGTTLIVSVPDDGPDSLMVTRPATHRAATPRPGEPARTVPDLLCGAVGHGLDHDSGLGRPDSRGRDERRHNGHVAPCGDERGTTVHGEEDGRERERGHAGRQRLGDDRHIRDVPELDSVQRLHDPIGRVELVDSLG